MIPAQFETRFEIKPRRTGRLWESLSSSGQPLLLETEALAAEVTAAQILRREGGVRVKLEQWSEGLWYLTLAFETTEPQPGAASVPAFSDRPAPADLPRANPFCETCRWWRRWTVQSNPGGTFGECRRNSPLLALVRNANHEDRHLSKWPNTRAEDWCGRHAATPGVLALDVDRDA